MSMDLQVWAARAFEIPGQLPRAERWVDYNEEFAFDGGAWQVLVLTEASEPSDLVSEKLPGASHVAYVTLEPLGASDAAYDFLEEVVRKLARDSAGVWVDPSGTPYRHDEGSF